MNQIVKKSSLLIFSQLAAKGVSFLYTLFLLRFLDPGMFGLYAVALAYFSLVSSVADFGISRYFVKEIAREEKDVSGLVTTVIFLRLFVLCLVSIILGLGFFFFDHQNLRSLLSILAILAIVPSALSWTVNDAFIATSKAKLYALGGVVVNLATTVLGVIFVTRGFSVVGVVLALLLGQYIYAFYSLAIYSTQKIGLSKSFRKEFIKEIIWGALPYGFLSILGLIYFKIDTLMLAYIKGSFEAGIYSAAYRFLEAIVFVPTSVSLIVFPMMSKWHNLEPAKVAQLSRKIIRVMGVMGLAVMILYMTVLPEVIRLFLPNYLPSIQIIQILALSIPFMFIHVPLSQALLSSDKYLKQIIMLSVVTVSFNVLTNLFFIPKYGLLAASWITVLSDVFSLALLLFVMHKYLLRSAKISGVND